MTENSTVPEIGCPHCWSEHPDAAWEFARSLRGVAELVDDVHLGVSVLACPRCGQQFISTFVEEVDWVDGDDPQYCSLLPLGAQDSAWISELRGEAALSALADYGCETRSLRSDYPKGGPRRFYWSTGLVLR